MNIRNRPLSGAALAIMRPLEDGEWHPIVYRHRLSVDRLERGGLINVGIDEDGFLIAIATDAGLARIKPRAHPAITEIPLTHPMVRP
jgi:hypothetical protein